MPTMHDSNEGQTQYVTDTQEAMRDAQSLHRLRMMPKEQQDVAIIMHYAAAAAVAMQGSRLVESKRFGGGSEHLNEAIGYVADALRKLHQTDFGTTLPCNGIACTAQSAEKIAQENKKWEAAWDSPNEDNVILKKEIARLEAENAALRQQIEASK